MIKHSKVTTPDSIPVLALFQKRIDGDGALLQLARLRFSQAGVGAEFYAESPEELELLMKVRPSAELPVTVHLPRSINLLDGASRRLVQEFARKFRNRVTGLILHDQLEVKSKSEEYKSVLGELDRELSMSVAPRLFVEYAVGLELDAFVRLHRSIRGLRWISPCLDVGHVGIWSVRKEFFRRHPGLDICSLSPVDPELPELIDDVHAAVSSALVAAIRMVKELGRLGKPVHVHLHDGHPLSASSPFGVSDHLSFLGEIPLPFEYKGIRSLPLMFGPSGLSAIVAESLRSIGRQRLSFALEIHPTDGRIPLGEASDLFQHWADKSNAERMNFWLSVVSENALLLRSACTQLPQQRRAMKLAQRSSMAVRKREGNLP